MTKAPLSHIAPIDGMRAVAVMAVLLFHLGVAPFGGGYVGVDVFFVISGYLMIRIVSTDMEKGRYSIGGFLWRRFKRLVPALVAVSLTVLLATSLVYLPESFDKVAKSAIAANAFVGNLYFWQVTDYFERGADVAPFLHTWSLGVEAQFYVALAIAISILGWFGVRRLNARWIVWLFALAAASSFLLDVVMTNVLEKVTGSFYFPLTRFWEMLLGALVAFAPTLSQENRKTGLFLSFGGTGLIVFAIFHLDETSIFPGLNAVLPSAGAALMLLAVSQSQSFPNRVLSLSPLQFLGRISYSLYLWHWPLIVIYRYAAVKPLDAVEMACLGVASILLGFLSYTYIEKPFRDGQVSLGATRSTAAILAVCTCLAMLPFPIQTVRQQNIEQRSAGLTRYFSDDYKKEVLDSYGLSKCFVAHDGNETIKDHCLKLKNRGREILLLGDSHAAHLMAGLKHNFPGVSIAQANVTGCRALIDEYTAAGDICKNHVQFLFDEYLPRHRADLLVLAGRWKHDDLDNLQRTLRFLSRNGHNTLLVGPAIEYLDSVPSLLIRQSVSNAEESHKIGKMLDAEVLALSDKLGELAAAEGVAYISLKGALCNATQCDVFTRAGSPFQWDYGHYTEQGSQELVERVSSSIKLALISSLPALSKQSGHVSDSRADP